MALANWLNGDNFTQLRDKINAIFTLLWSGTSGQKFKSNGTSDPTWVDSYDFPTFVGSANKRIRVLTAETGIEYFNPIKSQTIFAGTQAVTGSYAALGAISYTTPNDGISRSFLIIGEVIASIGSASGDNSLDFQVYNSTDSTVLRSGTISFPDVGVSVTARAQINLPYVGSPGINKTIVLRVKRPTSNSFSIVTGSLTIAE